MTTTTQTKERVEGGAAPTTVAPNQSTAVATQQQPQAIAIIDGVEIPALIRERDNEAMLAGFMGEVVETWFYEFEIAGKKVEGVGVIGADEFARIQAERGSPITVVPYGISVVEVTRNDERGVQATVIMRDARTRRESVGIAFYPYFLKKKNGEKVYDDKADRKALSVAKRNAILDLIPQEEILAVLKARKQLIAQNRTRIAAMTQRAIAAAPEAAVGTPQKRGEFSGDAYSPTPLASSKPSSQAAHVAAERKVGPKASEEQIETLLNLIEDPSVNQVTKAAVTKALEIGVSQEKAVGYISQLREWIASQSEGGNDILPLSVAGAS